jgi:hypothetical protein
MNAKTRRVSPAGRYRSHFPFSTPRSRYVCLRRVGYPPRATLQEPDTGYRVLRFVPSCQA